MTQLSLINTGRTGYAVKRRSPSAMAAAIIFNGGVIALLLAMPGVQQVIKDDTGDLWTWNVPVKQDPPPTKVEPVKKDAIRTATPTDQVRQQELPLVPEPILPTGGTAEFTGSRDPGPLVVEPVRAVPPVHVPVFAGASRDPRFASAFKPPYPPDLVRQELEGSATVRITINEQGRVIACDLVKATNRAFYDETREQALKRWRFRPATSDGVPVQSQQTLTVYFQLDA
jgi:periplasmic protein TonB